MFALSAAVDDEIVRVLGRPKFARAVLFERRASVLQILRREAIWIEPSVRVTDCRDAKDNKYLELAPAEGADVIVSSDTDLIVLDPWRGVRNLRPADYLALL